MERTPSFTHKDVEFGRHTNCGQKSITERVAVLRELLPGIGFADEKLAEHPLPPKAIGWFAIPRWQKIAPTYGEAVEIVLDLIKKQRKGNFQNLYKRKGGLWKFLCSLFKRKKEKPCLCRHERTHQMLQALGNQQNGYDILVVAVQFDSRYMGWSVRQAREVFDENEFGLGAFEIGCIILTDPERFRDASEIARLLNPEYLQRREHRWIGIDCAGDIGNDGCCAPLFRLDGDMLRFRMCPISILSNSCGSATGFLVL